MFHIRAESSTNEHQPSVPSILAFGDKVFYASAQEHRIKVVSVQSYGPAKNDR
jgi:hypothetical protein